MSGLSDREWALTDRLNSWLVKKLKRRNWMDGRPGGMIDAWMDIGVGESSQRCTESVTDTMSDITSTDRVDKLIFR